MPGFLILRRTRGGQEASHFDQRSGWARARTREERLERDEGGRGREGREKMGGERERGEREKAAGWRGVLHASRSVEFRWECRVSPRCHHRIRLGRHVVTSSRLAWGVFVRMGRAGGRQRPARQRPRGSAHEAVAHEAVPLAVERCREAENHNAPGFECSSMWDGPPGGVLALWPQ